MERVERLQSRVDDAFHEIHETAVRTAKNAAHLDGLKGQISRLANEQEKTNDKLESTNDKIESTNELISTLRIDWKEVAVRTSLICGVAVTVVTGGIGAGGIWLIQHAVKQELRQNPAQTQQFVPPASRAALYRR